jgi:hypothetical protein
MKRIIAVLLMLSLLFVLGCGAKTQKDVRTIQNLPESASESTNAAVDEADNQLEGIDELDEEFLTSDLEELDSELDFEI